MTRTSQVPPVALYGEDAPELCNPVLWNGLATSAYHAWAFWRAEQVALAPSPFRAQNDIRIVMGMIRSLPPRSVGAERLAAILRRLLDGALAPLAGVAARPRILLALGLPERMGDEHGELRFQRERSRLVAEAFQHLEARAAEVEVEAVPTGHASFAECIERAAQGIRAGRTDVALVGGIDTGYDPEVVQKALDEGRIYDGANLDGFCPGEGGAMWLMMPRGSAARLGLPATRVEGLARTLERAHSYTDAPCRAEGLTAAANALTMPLRKSGRTLDLWLHDVTSEVYRVHEMNLAWPRAAHDVMSPKGTIQSLHPAFGDLGAAFGATAAALAAEAFSRGDPATERCIITASSPHEQRAAILLRPGR